MELSEELKKTKEEAERLRKRIEDAGLSDEEKKSEEKDRASIFRSAVKNRGYNSDAAVAKLRELEQALPISWPRCCRMASWMKRTA